MPRWLAAGDVAISDASNATESSEAKGDADAASKADARAPDAPPPRVTDPPAPVMEARAASTWTAATAAPFADARRLTVMAAFFEEDPKHGVDFASLSQRAAAKAGAGADAGEAGDGDGGGARGHPLAPHHAWVCAEASA